MMIQVRLSLLLLLVGLTCVPQMKAAACDTLPAASARGYQSLLQAFLDANCYTGWQHDPQIRSTNGVHPRVKVYYSPSMWNWMTTNKRQGDVPDGAILVKEQYGIPETPTKLSDWAIMVRDSKAAWDGWYWADLVPSSSVVPPVIQPPSPCEEAMYPSAGFRSVLH